MSALGKLVLALAAAASANQQPPDADPPPQASGAPRRGATRVEGPSSPLSPPDTEADHAAAASGARSVSRDGDVGNGAESAAATPSAFTSLDGLMAKHRVKAPSEIFDEAMRLRSGAGGHRKRARSALSMLEVLAKARGAAKLPASNATAAARELGFMHLHGEGTVSDAAAAVHYFETAADSGDADAQHALGVLYSTGFGVHRDPSLAATCLYFAAEGGSVAAQLALGYRHLLGVSASKQCHKSLLYYRPVAEKVVASAQRLKGGGAIEKVRLTLDNPKGVSKRGADDDVLHYYEHSALKGSVDTQLIRTPTSP